MAQKKTVVKKASRSWSLTQKAADITLEELQEKLKPYVYIGQLERGKKGGEQGYEHYQIYIENPTPVRFDTLKSKLPTCHLEERKGTKQQMYDYVTKSDTKIGETFSNGEIDLTEEQGRRSDLMDIVAMVKDGATDYEIIDLYPSQYLLYHKHIESVRELYLQKKFGNVRRLDLQVVYIYGAPNVGKTRYVQDKYGDDKVFRMSDYGTQWNNERFDGYHGEDIILFEEFRSSIKIAHMLQYLDVYPVQLPARYHNKMACYTKVYIVSNEPLYMQYVNVQKENPVTWQAFLRRITAVYNFDESKDTPLPRALWTAVELTKDKTEQLGF